MSKFDDDIQFSLDDLFGALDVLAKDDGVAVRARESADELERRNKERADRCKMSIKIKVPASNEWK